MQYLVFTVLILSSLSFAGTPLSITICPSINDEAIGIIGSIRDLQNQLKSSENNRECQSLSDSLGLINKALNTSTWSKLKNGLTNSSIAELEGEEVDQVSTFIDEISTNLKSVTTQITGAQSHCIEEKNKTSFLAKFSTTVKEVSGIIGNVGGPYQMMVNLGGGALASVLTGIDKFFSKDYEHFKKNVDEKYLFMNQFCSYSEIQKDIADYINVEERIKELKILGQDIGKEKRETLISKGVIKADQDIDGKEILTDNGELKYGAKGYLQYKLDDLSQNCKECNGIIHAWNTKEKGDKILKKLAHDSNLVDTINKPKAKFARCAAMSQLIHTSQSSLYSYYKLLENYKNPLMDKDDKDFIAKVIKSIPTLKTTYPDYNECIQLEDDKISLNFNKFISSNIIDQNERFFSPLIAKLQAKSNKEYREPLGDYTINSLNRIKWVKNEIIKWTRKVKSLKDSISTLEIKKQMLNLDEKYLQYYVPNFLKYLSETNIENLATFKKSIKSNKKEMLKHYKKYYPKIKKYEQLKKTLSLPGALYAEVFIPAENKLLNKLKLSLDESKNMKRYCDYIYYLEKTTIQISDICFEHDESIKKHYAEIKKIDKNYYQQIKDANLWTKRPETRLKSRVQEYMLKLENWRKKKETRWCKMNDTRAICLQ